MKTTADQHRRPSTGHGGERTLAPQSLCWRRADWWRVASGTGRLASTGRTLRPRHATGPSASTDPPPPRRFGKMMFEPLDQEPGDAGESFVGEEAPRRTLRLPRLRRRRAEA
jgi:hypothetical protein